MILLSSNSNYSELGQEAGLIQTAESIVKCAGCSPVSEPSPRIDTLLIKTKNR